MYADFRRFYGLDLTVEVMRTPPGLLIALVEELPEEAALTASLRGGPQFRGWTRTQSLLADLYDAVNQNTVATGQWKKGKAPKIAPWPRPKKKPKRPTSVADIRRRFGGIDVDESRRP